MSILLRARARARGKMSPPLSGGEGPVVRQFYDVEEAADFGDGIRPSLEKWKTR